MIQQNYGRKQPFVVNRIEKLTVSYISTM